MSFRIFLQLPNLVTEPDEPFVIPTVSSSSSLSSLVKSPTNSPTTPTLSIANNSPKKEIYKPVEKMSPVFEESCCFK
jgi:hypothetical protein